jgi:hypothetical protein
MADSPISKKRTAKSPAIDKLYIASRRRTALTIWF